MITIYEEACFILHLHKANGLLMVYTSFAFYPWHIGGKALIIDTSPQTGFKWSGGNKTR